MSTRPFRFFILGCSLLTASAQDYTLHSFTTHKLNPHFWSEGANFGDFNKDGVGDVVSGPYWYEGPNFERRHEYYPAKKTFERKLSDGSTETTP